MILNIHHPDMEGNQATRLGGAEAVGQTSLTVLNSNGFLAGQYVVIGKPGAELSELRKIATITNDTTIVTDALEFAHAVDAVVTHIQYNQLKIYKSSTKTGTYTLLDTINIKIDEEDTPYNHVAGLTTDYYKTAYYNATELVTTSQSAPISSAGPSFYTLQSMLERVLILYPDKHNHHIYEGDALIWINEAYERLYRMLITLDRDYELQESLAQTLTGVQETAVPDGCIKITRLEIAYDGVNYSKATLEEFNSADEMGSGEEIQTRSGKYYSEVDPHYYIQAGKWGARPIPTSAAKYNLWYTICFTPLADMDDELVLGLRPFSSIVVDHARHKAHLRKGDTEMAERALAAAMESEKDFLVEVGPQNDRNTALDMIIDVNEI